MNNTLLDSLHMAAEGMEDLKTHYAIELKESGYKCLLSGICVFEVNSFICDCMSCNAEASLRAALRELKVLRAAITAELQRVSV
jgi:hypothetical protein